MKTFNIDIPKKLIPTLANEGFNGAILLYMNNLTVVDGFALNDDEFVTSIDTLKQAFLLAGFIPQQLDIIKQKG